MNIVTIKRIARNPWILVEVLAQRGVLKFVPDKLYLRILFRAEFGVFPNLESPNGFNEKIQWLKLNDRRNEYINWVDKISAKEKVKEVLGEKYIVPIINTWENAEDIDFNIIPDVCVLKCNHDQGSTIVYRRGISNEEKIVEHFKKRLKRNAFNSTREWPYLLIKSRVLCEEYLADEIIDYKLFCFNGEPRIINIGQKNQLDKNTRVTFLDLNWKSMDFQRDDFERVEQIPDKPKCYDELISVAKKLARGIPFVRTDFFVINDKIYFSEFTLYPTSGLIKFSPPEADYLVGKWLDIHS